MLGLDVVLGGLVPVGALVLGELVLVGDTVVEPTPCTLGIHQIH